MLSNPFTPMFGGKPDVFFGRRNVLSRFDAALLDKGSETRALFVTGPRGSGKTALLEQLSTRAERGGLRVIDLGPDGTVGTLVRRLVRHGESTEAFDPGPGVNALGVGVSASGGSSAKTTSYPIEDLQLIFLEACEREKRGILVTIDEVQKVPLDEMSVICGAFQMASRKGHDVMLALAGLPWAFDRVIHHEGCTYMRRSDHEELGLLDRMEVQAAFNEAFGRVDGVSLTDPALEALVSASYGHPYVMQLLGYFLVARLNERAGAGVVEVGEDDAAEVIPLAVETYCRRALKPLVDELGSTERSYLAAMVQVEDERHEASTAAVAEKLGKDTAGAARTRDALLKAGTIAAPRRGVVRLAIPYLRGYLRANPPQSRAVQLIEQWDV